MLLAYQWPGNIRELRNALERAIITCESDLIGSEHLPLVLTGERKVEGTSYPVSVPVGTTIEEAERLLILKTLASANNNKTRAAEILGISLKTLHNKLHRYGV